MNQPTDTTPLVTRFILVAVLLVTPAALGLLETRRLVPDSTADIALLLWLFTGLFVLRVLGQVLVAIRPRNWLPPMQQWNFIPYPVLLPIQILFIVVMVWIDMSFSSNTGMVTAKSTGFGNFLVTFSAVYASAMLIRYTIRMYRLPDQRWFGGTIPIVFHLVLASYLYTWGCFHVCD